MSEPKMLSFPGLGIGEFEINPIIFSIGEVKISWYAVIILTGIILAIFYVHSRFKEYNLSTDDLLDFILIVVPSGIVGARLYFVAFKLENYIIRTGNFWKDLGDSLYKIIAAWEGGLAIYGAVIAGGLAAVLVARHKKIKLLKILDMLAPAVMMAQAVGRWGNFTNVEAFGGPTTLPWRMCSPRVASNFYGNGLVDTDGYFAVINGELGAHPTFFYESMWNIIGFTLIYFLFVKNKKLHKFDGQLFYSYLTWYGLGRMWIEGLRTDSLYLMPGIRVSQMVAFLSFLAGVGLLIFGFIRLYKYGKGEMLLVIDRGPATKEEKKEGKNNGTNNQRKRSSSKSKRKYKK